jgi:hypothetical protein
MPTFQFENGTEFNGTLNNLILARQSDIAAILSGDQLNPDFIATLKSLRPKALRFLNYNGTNTNPQSMQSNYADIVSGSYISYMIDQFTAWSGTASGDGSSNYTIASGSSTAYTEGMTIQAKFTNVGTTGTPTLCVNNINACANPPPIFSSNLAALTAAQIPSNIIMTLRYDALLGVWIAGRTGYGNVPGFNGGPSISSMVALANAVNADLWYTVPCFASDNLITGVVNEILSTLKPSQNLIIEYANEVWNEGYVCTQWAKARGTALGWTPSSNRNRNGFYALRTRQMAALVESAAGSRSNYRIVLANQYADAANSQVYRFNGTDLNGAAFPAYCTWVGGSWSGGGCIGDPGYNKFPNRPADHVHHAAYAPYYAGAQLLDTDSSYQSFSGQIPKTVNGATPGNPTTLQTSTAHGYNTGDRICTGTLPISGGTAFTGSWAALNRLCFNVENVPASNQLTISYDSTGFAAYSSNGGAVQRFANQMKTLVAAADSWASGNYATAISQLDGDIRTGTNYGLAPPAAKNYAAYPISSYVTATAGYFDVWNTIAASYTSARPNGVTGMKTAMYENGFQGVPPTGASFMGTISGGMLTVTAVSAGSLRAGQYLGGPGIPGGVVINGNGPGGAGQGGPGTYRLLNAGSISISSPTAMASGPCVLLGLDISYCGYGGKIANLLGVVASTHAEGQITPDPNSYKMSSAFAATVKYQLDQYMTRSKAEYPGWLLITGGGTWSLMQGDIYAAPYASFEAIGQYRYP